MSGKFRDKFENRVIWGLPFAYKIFPHMKHTMLLLEDEMHNASPGVKEIYDNILNCEKFVDFADADEGGFYETLYTINYGSVDNPAPAPMGKSIDIFVFACLLFMAQNMELAMFHAARAALMGDRFQFVYLTLFLFILWQMEIDESPQEMLSLYANRVPADYYYSRSWEHLENNNLDKFDHYIQRINAWNWHTTLFFNVSRAVAQRIIGNDLWEEVKQDWLEQTREKFFSGSDAEAIGREIDKWEDDENKDLIARMIARLCIERRLDRPQIVEIGCHAGTLLNHIQKKCKSFYLGQKLIGIEPDEPAVKVGMEKYPHIDFHVGMHDIAYDLIDKGDILLLSYMCLLNPMETIQEIFNWASGVFRYIFIADDIVNLHGDIPVLRRYYMIHPFKKMLEEAGFKIAFTAPLARYTVAANGIICAENSENL